MITLFRIDDRLIHGQVAMAWSRTSGADIILAVDKKAANNSFQKMALLMAKPAGVDAEIVDPANFKEVYQKEKNRKVMVVVGNPIEAKEVIDKLDETENIEVNLGNLKSGENKERVSGSVYITKDEKQALDALKENGVNIYIQGTPTSKKETY